VNSLQTIESSTLTLILHGSIVVLAGLLSGFPLRDAILNGKKNVNAWRVAHSVMVMDGMWMLIVGIVVPHLALDRLAGRVLVCSLVTAGYGFVAAFTIGAWRGVRGLKAKPWGLNTLLFGAHSIGVVGSLAGTIVVLYGAVRALYAQ